MDATYPTTYRDRHGTVETTIHNDGKMLSMTVRGVTFCGTDFDALEPESASNHDDLKSFTLQRNELCSCVIVTDMPMPVVRNGVTEEAQLRVLLELGDPAPNGGIDRELLSLQLQFGEGSVETTKGHSHFEDALLEIQQQLPDATYMLACINCAYSDYNPLGSGLFGTMACFRGNKEEYLAVKSKADIFRIWNTLTEYVQETYRCEEFERRTPGTGYRG